MKRAITLALWSMTAMFLPQSSVSAFETSTHQLINQQGALGLVLTNSGQTFDEFLRSQLLFSQGLDTPVNGQIIRDWLGTGGVAEDQYLPEILGQKLAETAGGVTRSPRHFHTPLKTWDQSGLNLGGIQFESSPRWAQLADQGFTGKAAWGDARSTYFQALTATDPAQRATLFGNTFKILGQLMHLVADMGSVAHTRNAQHILGDPFEEFVGQHDEMVTGFLSMDPSYVRFTPTNDAVATVPVARLWDTDTYNGSNPGITAQTTSSGATVGLAEFTSANFFSRHTISRVAGADPILPYPAIDQLVPGSIETLDNGNRRQYRKKDGQGIIIDHMVTDSAFNLFVPSTWQRFSLDDNVFKDYAAALLPRAIGYSAGLLDYFFRGRFGGSCYTPCCDLMLFSNTTPGESVGDGIVVMTVWSGHYNQMFVSQSVTVHASQEYGFGVRFKDLEPTFLPPDWYYPEPFIVSAVFRGRLGNEDDAVMVTNTGWACQ